MRTILSTLLLLVVTSSRAKTLFNVQHERAIGWSLNDDDVSPETKVNFDVYLKERNGDKMREIVEIVSDPRSEHYGTYMTTAEIEALVRPSESDLNVVLRWLSTSSFAEFTVDANGRAIHVEIPVREAETLLDTNFRTLVHDVSGARIVRADAYALPDDVAKVTRSIFGLHGLPLPRLPALLAERDVPAQPADVTPDVLASTYDISGVKVTKDDTKVRQAVAEFQGQYMDDDDLAKFFKDYVDDYEAGKDDTVYKFVGDQDQQSGQAEASLDIQYIMGVAPKLLTEFWLWNSMDFCGDLKNWTEAILANDEAPLVHSVSYGWQGDLSQLQCTQDKIDAVDEAFVKLAAKGITIIFASGDSGSGYTPAAANCSAQSEDTALEGKVSQSLEVGSADECCEFSSRLGGKGYTFTPPSGPNPGATCRDGDVGTKDKQYTEGTNKRVIAVPSNSQGPEICCEVAQGKYFSYAPADTGNAKCTIFDAVTGKMSHAEGHYAGKSSAGNRGNCTIFESVIGMKSATGSVSGTAPSHETVVLWPSWPASSPYVTAVGATRFVGQKVGNEEMATDQFGSGGGFSKQFNQSNAKWQADAVAAYVNNPPKDSHFPPEGSFPANGRATPDVSALGEGYQVYINGNVQSIGGTSASAPAFAGMVSLLNEARSQNGQNAMGFLNPFLYQNEDAFTDVTKGTNAIGRGTGPIAYGFNCTKGWDPATGLGTPVFSKLLKAALAN
eukprot:g3326.t1